ncbi:MAG: pyridoxal phosphate-dependent aminotransferase [Flavobacteriaceae bacterium]
MDLSQSLSRNALDAPESGIVEVMNYGRGRPGMIPLWAGEGDLPTPAFIGEAAARALAEGETFYTWQRGLPELRQALADYHARLYGRPFDPERFYVTGSGMQSIRIAIDLVAAAGDEIVLPTPAWPNLSAACGVTGVTPVEVPIALGNQGWKLDLDRLFDACGQHTRALFINSPANPTGWTMTRDEAQAILDFARARKLWIIADEIYAQFYYHGRRAPSFHDVAEADDRIIFVNSFSKNWAMTGWRVGWLSLPASLGQTVENLIQYSTSGVAAFMQRGAIAALNEGDATVAEMVERARRGREICCGALESTGRARFAWPDGAFYLFFGIEGESDTSRLGLRLVDEANIGLAPGSAFGKGGDGYLRLCFLRRADQLEEAMERLTKWIAGR